MNNTYHEYHESFFSERPRISEIEDMADFCKRYKRIYIYGASENCEYLGKFLSISEIEIAGYVVTISEKRNLNIYNAPILFIDEILNDGNAGILLGLSDKYYELVISILKDKELAYFRLSEHNKCGIARGLKPQIVSQLIIEISLVDHCNLKCRNCDHYSNVAQKQVLDINEFTRDIERLSEICAGSLAAIKLLGGEPLLNPDITVFIKVTRKNFPRSQIHLITNGLLLLGMSDEFWTALAENQVVLQVTRYPTGIDYEAIYEKALRFGLIDERLVNYGLFVDHKKIMLKYPFDLTDSQNKYAFICCNHRIGCTVLKRGRIYPCPPLAHIDHFNEYFNQSLTVSTDDWIDLYKVKSYQEIANFLVERVPFCRYCDVKHRFHYTNRFAWSKTSGKLEEYLWD